MKINFEEIIKPSDKLAEEMDKIKGGQNEGSACCDKGTLCESGSSESSVLDAFC